jgi:Zn-dependent M16 (insulinase) family peptidase
VHGGDPFPALELDSDLAQLGDLHDLVRAQLVENTHRARVTLEPDAGLEGRVRDEENAWLAVVAPTLDAQEIVEQAQRLAAPTSHDYPKRGLTPLEALTTLHAPEPASVAGGIAHFDLPTDGITYLTVRIDLSDLDDELVPLLGPLSGLMAKRATEGTRADAIRVVNHARVDARGDATAHWLEISARALTRDGHELLSMLRRALDLADLSALPDVAAERAGAIEQGLFGSAQAHLRRLASASLRRCGRIEDSTRGLGQLRFLKAKEFARVVELRAAVLDRSRYAGCVVGERLAGLGDVLTIEAASPSRPITDVLRGPRPHVARVAQLPNAFTCAAYSIPGLENEDGPAIAVLAQVLFAGFLNAEVRRGGAYGVDFQALPERGVLWISTRRDPLPDASYHAIDDGIARFATKTWDAMPAADGLIGILRVTDPVDTPATAARRAWLGTFTGHTAEAWNAYRRRVLDVTDDDLARVAADYLTEPSRATLVGPSMKDGPYDEIGDV